MSENFRKNNIAQSVFEKNFNQISDSKKEILSQKYNCSICLEIIKHENPFLCYECQKIFHHSCLSYWNDRQKHLNKILSCPNCRNELPLEKWKVFRNYDETRTKDAQILNQLGKSFNSNEYIDKATNLFKLVLNKLNIIHLKINSQKNYKLNNLIEEFKYNLVDPSIDEISTVIIEELDLLEEYITKMKEDIQKNKYKNEINLKYLTEKGGTRQIFECDFVQRNINNISLIINGYKLPIVEEYNLKAGENDVTICFKNTLTDLSNMFYFSEDLYNIDELKYLNTENVTDFSNMFRNCKKLSNIKALENWDTSKAETFQGMFDGCELITNIKPLKNWNVSSCKNFSGMFCSCNISEIAPLENWKVSNGKFFDRFLSCNLITDISPLKNLDMSKCESVAYLFEKCKSLSDISPLKNWDISNVKNLEGLFCECENFTDISPLKNWNLLKVTNLAHLFEKCKNISDISPLKNWNVSNVKKFEYLFYKCSLITDIKPLGNWNVSNGTDLSCMFVDCILLKDLNPIKNWNVSNCEHFWHMFDGLEILTDVSPLKNWNISKGYDFAGMFYGCKSLKNRNILKNWNFSHTDYNSLFNF